MLHLNGQEIRIALPSLCLLACLCACKPDTGTASAEEAAYLADYEATGDKWGFMDTLGTVAIPARYDDVGLFREGLAAVNQAGHWGYIDRSGKPVIPFMFKAAWAFHEGYARVSGFEGPDFYIDHRGKALKSSEWQADDDFREGLARVRVGELTGFVDTAGRLVIEPLYSQASGFAAGLAIVTKAGLKGVINQSSREVIPASYSTLRRIAGRPYFIGRMEDKWHLIASNGKTLWSSGDGEQVTAESDWLAVCRGEKCRFVYLHSLQVFPELDMRDPQPLGEGLWSGKINGTRMLVRPPGEIVHRGPFDQLNRYADDFAVFGREGTWGYLDTTGREVLGPVLGLAWDYQAGFARAAFSDGIGFINRSQQLAFYPPPGTVDMRDFHEGLAPVQLSKE